MDIEPFTMDMYEDIIELWKKTGITITSSESKKEIKRMLDHNPNLFIVGKEGNKIVSAVCGGFDGRRGYVHHLSVDPSFQKKGLGTKMMKELQNRFSEMNVHKVHLFVEKDNLGVIKFYKKIGWEKRDDLIMMSYVPEGSNYFMKKATK